MRPWPAAGCEACADAPAWAWSVNRPRGILTPPARPRFAEQAQVGHEGHRRTVATPQGPWPRSCAWSNAQHDSILSTSPERGVMGLKLKATTSTSSVERFGAPALEGAHHVPAHVIYDIVRKLPRRQVRWRHRGQARMTLRYGRSRFTLQTLPEADFPDITSARIRIVRAGAPIQAVIDKTQFRVSTRRRVLPQRIYFHARSRGPSPAARRRTDATGSPADAALRRGRMPADRAAQGRCRDPELLEGGERGRGGASPRRSASASATSC